MVERWSPVSEPRPYIGFRNTARSGKTERAGNVCI